MSGWLWILIQQFVLYAITLFQELMICVCNGRMACLDYKSRRAWSSFFHERAHLLCEWFVVRCESKNEHQRDSCLHVGLSARTLSTNSGLIVNIMNEEREEERWRIWSPRRDGDSWHSLRIIHPRYRGWSGSNKKSPPMGPYGVEGRFIWMWRH